MEDYIRTDADDALAADRATLYTNANRPPLLSWGAVWAGAAVVLATSWLLYLLGLALGVSIADASDTVAINDGLGTGAVIWMLLSCLIAYLVGSLLAARLCGKTDSTVGMLHGFVLWSLATTIIVVFGYFGVKSLLQTGYSVLETTVSSTASAISATTSTVADSATAIGSAAARAADTEMVDNIQARLKRRAARIVANSEQGDNDDVTQEEVSSAIDSLEGQDLQVIAAHIASGEARSAREKLASATNLSENEVRQIVEGISNEFEDMIGTGDNETELVGDVENALQRQAADMIAALDARGGPNLTDDEVKQALEEMTPETMQNVAMALLRGKTQNAKDILTSNTSLTAGEINDVVDGVREDVSKRIERYQTQVSQAVEAASTYAQAVLWTAFAASAMGLAISLLGGYLGTETTRRLEVELQGARTAGRPDVANM